MSVISWWSFPNCTKDVTAGKRLTLGKVRVRLNINKDPFLPAVSLPVWRNLSMWSESAVCHQAPRGCPMGCPHPFPLNRIQNFLLGHFPSLIVHGSLWCYSPMGTQGARSASPGSSSAAARMHGFSPVNQVLSPRTLNLEQMT